MTDFCNYRKDNCGCSCLYHVAALRREPNKVRLWSKLNSILTGTRLLVANFVQKCRDISQSKYDINTLPALGLKQKLRKEHSLRNVPVWATVTRLTDSVTLPNFLNLNVGYRLDDYGFKMHFSSSLHPKGIRNTRECSFPWTKWAPPSPRFPTPTTTARTERAPNHVWPQPRLKSEPRRTRR